MEAEHRAITTFTLAKEGGAHDRLASGSGGATTEGSSMDDLGSMQVLHIWSVILRAFGQ